MSYLPTVIAVEGSDTALASTLSTLSTTLLYSLLSLLSTLLDSGAAGPFHVRLAGGSVSTLYSLLSTRERTARCPLRRCRAVLRTAGWVPPRELMSRALSGRGGTCWVRARDVIFRKITNRNQTDTNEITNTETTYQTNFILPQNTDI